MNASTHALARSLAKSSDLPPALAEAGGRSAIEAIAALKQARDAGGGGLRMSHLARAQQHISALDPHRHGTLVQHLQARLLALQGRGNDTRMAHVAVGEMVVPKHLQTPAVVAALHGAARRAGIDLAALRIGSGRNVINPRTGQPEFDYTQYEDAGDFGGDTSDDTSALDDAGDPGHGDESAGEGAGYAFGPDEIENITVTAPAYHPSYDAVSAVPDSGVDDLAPPPDINSGGACSLPAGMAVPPNVSLAQNMQDASTRSDPFWFLNQVRNKHPWDYKQLDPRYRDFGNFNYGATGSAFGFPEWMLHRGAGVYQFLMGNWEPQLGYPWEGAPYGDDPRDQTMIQAGINYFKNGCGSP